MPASWYVEKKGKFYGPFKAEKVLAYAESGKISEDTPIAGDSRGTGAKPFSELAETLRNPAPEPESNPSPATGRATPQPEAAAAAPQSDEDMLAEDESDGISKEWYVCTPDRRFGPYSLGHLQNLLNQGKLKRNDRLQREGQSHLIDVVELFPEGPEAESAVAAPKQPAEKPRAARPEDKKTTGKSVQEPHKKSGGRKKSGGIVLALVVAGVTAAGILYFKPYSQEALRPTDKPMPGASLMADIKRRMDKTSPLRQQAAKAELPPFNELVQSALREGLNFQYQNLIKLRSDSQLIYSSDGPKNFGSWFNNQIRREFRYALDGGYTYTYLVDDSGFVFAVMIHHESFKRNLLEATQISDFAAGARRDLAFGKTSWTVQVVPGVLARLLWDEGSTGQDALQYICVMNAFNETN